MDKIKFVKNEAKTYLIESILNHKLIIGDFSRPEQKEVMRNYTDSVLAKLLRQHKVSIGNQQLDMLKEEILTEVVGFGALEKLINDPEITDILVNSPGQIYIEKKGKMQKASVQFDNIGEIRLIIERMMAKTGRRIDASSPFVDFKLEGGARVTAVIPPISVSTPFFCIRKVLRDIFSIEDLEKFGTLNPQLVDFLRYCVKARLNILVSGSTGVGKTTITNLLIKEFVPEDERIIVIEDTEEIVIDKNRQHHIRLITRAPNIEGKGEITLRDLVKLSLHLRPDRIIVGEVRGEEAFYFLQAINTGHEGSMCTIHANNSEDALHRLEILSMMDRPNIHYSVIRQFIKLGIDLVIHMMRLPSGQRIVSQASEFGYKGDACILKDIFALQRTVKNNQEIYEAKLTGHVPSFIDRLQIRTDIPDNFFMV